MSGHQDLDVARRPLAHTEQRSRAAAGQPRAFPAREHTRHPFALAGETRVAVRVDPAVPRVKAARAHPLRDACRTEPELRGQDRAVLPGGDEGCFTNVHGARRFVRHPLTALDATVTKDARNRYKI